MKCQFCNEKCRLLKEGEADYSNYDMTWYCAKHPVRVLHHVSVQKYSLRRDHSIIGTTRHWRNTSIRWVNNKGQMIMAIFKRDLNKNPCGFEVFNFKKGKGIWGDSHKSIFELKEYPKDFTPENIRQKISSLIIFS